MIQTPKDAAGALTQSIKQKGYTPEALHEYTDADGKPHYWRVRLKNKETGEKYIRPMSFSGERYELKEPSFEPGKKPLYQLHRLAQDREDPIYICEGEWCVDRLLKLGVLATTSGAANSAETADWSPLAGREVIIWPDNDEAGKNYGNDVAVILQALDCTIHIVDVDTLSLPPKGDVIDWMAQDPTNDKGKLATIPLLFPGNASTDAAQEDIRDVISHLALLPNLEYEQQRRAVAKKFGIKVPTLDKEVYAAREAYLSAQEDESLFFPAVQPWHTPVDGAELLNKIYSATNQFIICEPKTAIAVALWIAFTWFIDDVQIAPLAVITAPEKRCGKSQLLDLIGRLARKPLPASNISASALFRVIEAHSPTLLIDEADSFFEGKEELRGIINSGHSRSSAFVIRTVGDDFEPKSFSTWGAKAISGIGKLADTLMDRSIVLELRRKLPSEKVARLRYAAPDLFPCLASKLARFSHDGAEAIQNARPVLPDNLNDRAQDNWEPLLAIADYAGGEWPQRAREAANAIAGGNDESSVSYSTMLLSDIQEIFNEKGGDRIFSKELINALCEDDLKPWATYSRGHPIKPHQLARRLSAYGIKPTLMRIGYENGRGYKKIDFSDAFARYLSSHTFPENAVTPLQNSANPIVSTVTECNGQNSGNVTGVTPLQNEAKPIKAVVTPCNVTKNEGVTLQAASLLGCNGVTDKKGVYSEEKIIGTDPVSGEDIVEVTL